jgi:hypothetical protein
VQVYYRAHHQARTPEVVYEHAQTPAFCCPDMQLAWGVWVGFGLKDCRRTTSRDVNFWVRVPQAKGGFVWGLIPINHYPFCGEAVGVCRVK